MCFMGKVLSGVLILPVRRIGLSNPSFMGHDFRSLWNTGDPPCESTLPLCPVGVGSLPERMVELGVSAPRES